MHQLRPLPDEPPPLHGRALDNLTYIRSTMERARSFTAVSGWGLVVMGAIGLVAAAVAARQTDPRRLLLTWGVAATLAVAGSGAAMAHKASRTGESLRSGPARKFLFGVAPPLLAAGPLTVMLYRAGLTGELPALWLLLYGAAAITGGAYSVSALPLMGLCFMGAGAVAFVAPPAWGPWLMAGGFGLLHLAFGVVVARRHGG
ncbi:MAG: hypothetical protein U0531_12995 [Dehalococcoidia bacterium]